MNRAHAKRQKIIPFRLLTGKQWYQNLNKSVLLTATCKTILVDILTL